MLKLYSWVSLLRSSTAENLEEIWKKLRVHGLSFDTDVIEHNQVLLLTFGDSLRKQGIDLPRRILTPPGNIEHRGFCRLRDSDVLLITVESTLR